MKRKLRNAILFAPVFPAIAIGMAYLMSLSQDAKVWAILALLAVLGAVFGYIRP